MNLVRGVAGFLRRSSLSQEGNTSQVQHREASAVPVSRIEVQFSDVGDEKVLHALWQGYKESLGKDESEKALEIFLVYFLRVYEGWMPGDLGNEYMLGSPSLDVVSSSQGSVEHVFSSTNPANKESRTVVGCTFGHPTSVVVGLAQELKGVISSLMELHLIGDSSEVSLSPSVMEGGMRLLHVLAILARSKHNQQVFRFCGGLQILMSLMKAAVVQLKSVAGVITTEDMPSSSVGMLSSFLQTLLAYTITIVARSIHAETKDENFLLSDSIVEMGGINQSSGSRRGSLERQEAADNSGGLNFGGIINQSGSSKRVSLERGGIAGSSIPLMETGGLNWFVELLRVVRKLRMSGTLSESSLEQVTLRTLRAALVANSRAQNHFRSIGGIDALMDGLVSPLDKQDYGAQEKEWCTPGDFQIQVLSLEVLREAVFRNLSSLQYLLEKGGVQKFAGIIIWAAFISPGTNSQEEQAVVDGDTLQDWNSQVAQLCRILCSFLVASGDIRDFVTGLAGGHDARGASGSYWELATRWVVQVLIGIFKNLEPFSSCRDKSQVRRLSSTTLQHYVLCLFRKMLAISPSVLAVFREEGLWQVLFSEYFFYFEMGFEHDALHHQDSPVIGAVADSETFSQNQESIPLQLEVISFVEIAAIGNSDYDNVPECQALMEALEQCAHIPSVATMIVKSLHRILQLAVDQTVRAFEQLNALILLSQVMDLQMQAFSKAVDQRLHSNGGQLLVENFEGEQKGSWTLLTFRETWKQSREAVFDLFAEYLLTSEKARIISLHSTKTLQVLFNLLWEQESRAFALRHILDLMKLPPASEEDQEAKLELCIKYLETLSQSALEGRPKDSNVLMELLSGICEILQIDYPYYQALFREGECFVHIVSLLNENLSEQDGKLLSLSVLQTLMCLLAGNEASKTAFRSLVGAGYTTLQTLLMSSHQGSPTEDLLSALLDMLVDGSFNVPANMVIQNEDIIALFFNILRQCCETLQSFGLLTFHRILEESTANRAACVKAGLLSLLLDWFGVAVNDSLITKLAVLIEAVGRHSISGKDMRRIFSLLRNVNQLSKPKHRKILLSVVQGMLKEEGPAVFFELSGKDSGIMITSMHWPNTKGFTLSCWMRVEKFPSVESGNEYESLMGLFTFLAASGKGYIALIGKDKLVVESTSNKRQSLVLNVQIQPKRWYFVCITHSTKGALSGGSILKVYVDGSLAASGKLRYPKFQDALARSTIGASSPLPTFEGNGVDLSGKLSFPFCGQLGPVYLFDDSLSSDQVLGIYSAGSGYMYSFLPTEVGCVPESLSANIIFDLKEGIALKVLFGFNAQASSGRVLLDVAANAESTTEKVLHEATIMAGTQLCYRRLVKDVIDCVGGVGVFFPLLMQLDQPQTSADFLMQTELSENEQMPCHFNIYDAAEVIELITSVLDNSSAHQQYMHQNKGMPIIGFLLQSVSPQHLTVGVVAALLHLLSIISKSSGTSVSKRLVEEVLLKVYLNLHIWIYTPYFVQRELLMALLNYAENETALAQSFITLPIILDIVQLFYWDKPRNRKMIGTKPLLHPVTKEVIGERPGREEVGKLRILLLSLAELLVRDSISVLDVKALLAYLEGTEDPVCLEDVLHMLLGLLGRKSFLSSFIENIQVFGGYHLFLSLLKRQEEPLRLLGLQIIGMLLWSVPSEKKGSWLLTITTGTTRAAYEHDQVERAKLTPLFAAITERLLAFPFTDLLRATLFDILLGGASPKQVLQRQTGAAQDLATLGHNITSFGGGRRLSTNSSQFVLPQILGIIFKFLLICEDSSIRHEVLRDLLRLLESNPSSSDTLVLEPAWQAWLFDLVICIEKKKQQVESHGNELMKLKEEELIIQSIFAIIHCYCIYNVRGGWKHVERTVNFAHMYAAEDLCSKFDLLHVILGDVLEAVLQARTLESGQMSQPCRDNTLYLLTLVDELLIKDTIQFLPFPSEDISESTCQDNTLTEIPGIFPLKASEIESTNVSASMTDFREQQTQALCSELREITNEHWCIYDRMWSLLRDINGKGKGETSTAPSLGQRARGLVESINIPAAEMAAAVVAGGLGAVVSMNPSKLIDKAIKLRGDRFPRVAFHLVLLYIHRASFEAASSCVQQFVVLLPVFLALENDQSKNRLQLFLWCLLEARSKLASMDNGARFHLISQLIRDTVDHGKNLLATNILDKDASASNDSASVQGLLQQDRIINAVKEEKESLKAMLAERSNEVQSLIVELKEALSFETLHTKLLEEQLHSTLGAICISDLSRRTSLHLAYEEDQQAVSNQWCHMFRHLTDERGPWSTLPFPNDFVISWKLDKSEDPWRRRFKLKRNYRFDEQLIHPQTSCENAVTSLPAEKATYYDVLGETSKLLLKGLRGISEEELPDMPEEERNSFDEDSQAPNLEDVGTLASESQENTEEGSAEQQEHATSNQGVDEILHSTVCVLVTCKRKIAGRLEIMQDCLHFYGEFIVDGTGGSSVFTLSGLLNYSEHIPSETIEQRSIKSRLGSKDAHNGGVSGETERRTLLDRVGNVQHIGSESSKRDVKRHRRWDFLKVKAVHGTRYLLHYTALEIFFNNSISPIFLNFSSQKHAKDVGLRIVSLRNKLYSGKGNSREKNENIFYIDKRLSVELAERCRDRWRRREISTFEYLMHLNTLAGRSYSDLTQYPVFPWIISDFSSEILDLNSSSSFRDLSKPVGALDVKRFEVFKERFQNFSDPNIPSFYYGSHYSNMGIVLFYLLRLEPFTSLHRNLQGGKFDHADRLFHSIEGAFANCLTNTSDVKELIPEFFYMPDFLVNSNRYHFGIKQDGEKLDNVVLPRWAKGSPEEFILKNREALESEYVSQHLHQWIDLIFGYKQRGRPALEAANVFYHLTYEGAVELEALDDRLQRAAVEDQIANFGQTPIQLFWKKHPSRGPPMPIARPLYYAPASITLTSSVPANVLNPGSLTGPKTAALIFVGVIEGKVVLVTSGLNVIIKSWLTPTQTAGNFTFSSSQDPFYGIGAEASSPYRIRGPFSENVEFSSWCFRTLQVRSSTYLLSCGHWDNSFRIISLNDGSLLQSNRHHKDVVSCLSVSSDGSIVATGSHDTTVMVWEIPLLTLTGKRLAQKDTQVSTDKSAKGENILFDKPRHVLCGHDDAVTCVAVSVELDIVVSGSRDASCIFHTLREGRYVRSLKHPLGSSISSIVLSKHGLMVLFSKDDLIFLLYSINGKHLASMESNGRINSMEISSCGEFLVCGGDHGQVAVRSIYTLEVIKRYEGTNTPILSLAVTPEDCILAGTQDGSLLIYSIETQQQKKSKILHSLRARQS